MKSIEESFYNISKEYLRVLKQRDKLLRVCKALESWWRLPNNLRTIESLEPIIIKAMELIEKTEGKK